MNPRFYSGKICRICKGAKFIQRIICFFLVLLFLYIFGIVHKILEIDFYNEFRYPLDIDILPYIEQVRQGKSPDVQPINYYSFSYTYTSQDKCNNAGSDRLRVVYLVKSAINNFERREAIRVTWGFEKRFSDVEIRTIFFVGKSEDWKIQRKIDEEETRNNDIVQANFLDSYYNNTIKTMMTIKWVVKYCPKAKFYFFSDDDMYVSTKNLLRFLRNPAEFPEYLNVPIASVQVKNGTNNFSGTSLFQLPDYELPDDIELYTGFVFSDSWPIRRFYSKWYISLTEYPYSHYPPYVTAGSFVLSREALFQFHFGSFFTKYFRFDDIYMGILAYKTNIKPLHNKEFYFYKKPYNVYNYRFVVTSHGYSDPHELITVWNEQKVAGNA